MYTIRQASDGTWELVDADGNVVQRGTLDALVAAVEAPAELHWSGPITVENRMTGDGRGAEAGAWTWEVPFALTWQREGGGHDGAVVVGTVWEVWRDGDLIHGAGTFDLGSEEGREAVRHVGEHLTNDVSIEPDSVDVELRVAEEVVEAWEQPMDDEFREDAPERETDDEGRVILDTIHHDDFVEVVLGGRIRTLALVTTAAYDEATIELMDGLTVDGLLGGSQDLALDDGQESDLADTLGDCRSELDAAAGALSDDDTRSAGTAIGNAQQLIDQALGMMSGDADTDDEDGDEGEGADDQQAAVVAAGVPARPPASWFDDPQLDGPTALQVDPDGRVYGHLATWGTCHIGRDDVCLTPPTSESAYAYFATGELAAECEPCDDGATAVSVPTGTITMGTGHASLQADPRHAAEHYDNSGTAVADVVAGEDAHGIWIAGALRPGVTDEQVRALRGSSLSGDWRRIGGSLELVAALAVNVPGFPIPRSVAASAGIVEMAPRARAHHGDRGTLALVAAGTLAPSRPVQPATEVDVPVGTTLPPEVRRQLTRMERAMAPQIADSLRREVHGDRRTRSHRRG